MDFKTNKILDKYTKEIITLHINYEIKKLNNNEIYKKIDKYAKKLNFSVKSYCDFPLKNLKQLYLGFSVLNENGEIIEVEEKNYLCPSTLVLEIDNKRRFSFYDPFDDDFLESLEWVLDILKKYKK